MIISRTPYRISFFGGGTDYPSWYLNHGGAVLAATIDKYCYLTCRYLPPFFEHRYRIVYSKIETVNHVEDILHPSVRETLKLLGIERGIELHHDGDLPARSGMGSSSAFTVGLLHALHSLQGRMVSKHQLATEAIHIEQTVLNETVGSQDQVMAAYGGLDHVRFLQSGDVVVRPLIMERSRINLLNDHLMLFYTGIKRTASEVASSYVDDIGSRRRQLRILSDLVDEGVETLCGTNDLSRFGELLNEAWQAKRSFSSMVSSSYIDQLYSKAISAGALGGKLLGAGGGGFMLFFVPPEKQQIVTEQLSGLIQVSFRFEFNGSKIAYYNPEQDYSKDDRIRHERLIEGFRELTDTPSFL
jgi:D-glycero-alpha-D-manno-heptose-7-phosphate kinase